jgi:hypothetical protein
MKVAPTPAPMVPDSSASDSLTQPAER